MLGAQDFWAGRDLYRAISAVTCRCLGVLGPLHSVASYDTQEDMLSRSSPRNKGHHRIWQICFISRCFTQYLYSNGRLTTSLYDKRYDFDFAIVNFPFLCSNIPLSPAYGVYIPQLIRYARACFVYEDFSKRGKLLTKKKMMLQG
jgi:hypothetical protein